MGAEEFGTVGTPAPGAGRAKAGCGRLLVVLSAGFRYPSGAVRCTAGAMAPFPNVSPHRRKDQVMVGWIVRIALSIAAVITGWFISTAAANFSIVQMEIGRAAVRERVCQ